MDGRRGIDLGVMAEREVSWLVADLLSEPGADTGHELRHDEFVLEMPQSGERIRGRERMREFQGAYATEGNAPTMKLRRVLVRDGLWVAEWTADYGGQVSNAVAIVELRDGKIWRETRYYAEPFEAPEWRAQWVETLDA